MNAPLLLEEQQQRGIHVTTSVPGRRERELIDTSSGEFQATGADWGTVGIRVEFVRPAPVGLLLADATAVQAGRRLGRGSAELTDPATGPRRPAGLAPGRVPHPGTQPSAGHQAAAGDQHRPAR
jgi:acyl-coenzyme A thioesterase PaaI-like protein